MVFIVNGCNENQIDVVDATGEKFILPKIVSPYYTWTTYTYWDPLYQQEFTQCTPQYSFSFMDFNYDLSFTSTFISSGYYLNTIVVNVNEGYRTTISWYNTDTPINPRTVVSAYFYVNGTKMNISVNLTEFYIPMRIHSEPYTVRVMIVDGK